MLSEIFNFITALVCLILLFGSVPAAIEKNSSSRFFGGLISIVIIISFAVIVQRVLSF